MSLQSNLAQGDRAADRIAAQYEKKLLKAYRDSRNTIKKELAVLYERYSVSGELKMADVAKYNRLKNLEIGISEEISKLAGTQIRISRTMIKDVYEEAFYRAAFALEVGTQAKLGFGMLPKKQVEAAIMNPLDRIGWPDRTREQARLATRQIKEEITRGIIQGKDYGSVARAVSERANMAADRALRIVRTEAHRSRSMGALDSFEHAYKQGVELEKVFSATLDDRTRDTHQSMDGQTVPMYDGQGNPGMFESPSGDRAEYPGGFSNVSENANCRCALRTQIMGYAPEFRRARGEGIIDYKNYNEWKIDRINK